MGTPQMTAHDHRAPHGGAWDRARGCVRAAILLVAETRYPSVAIANIPEATALASELALEARAYGVTLVVPVDSALPDSEILVHRS